MRIAIDCRLWSIGDNAKQFHAASLLEAILLHSEHSFFLLFDKTPPDYVKFTSVATIVVLKPVAHSAATRALWYDLRLPALLSAHRVNWFIGMAGYISLRTPVRQVLLLHDALGGGQFPGTTGWQGSWYRRRLPAMLEKAAFVTGSSAAQVRTLAPAASRFSFVALPFCPFIAGYNFPAGEMEKMKERISAGREYFLCEAGWQTLDDAVELLLAFSAFKKRMQSGLRLVLVGKPPQEKEWAEKMASYRYREDVVMVDTPATARDWTNLVGAAWALIHLPSGPHFQTLQTAICLGVPAITWPHEAIRELAGDAVLYCTDLPGETLSNNLMRIYKDEKLRSDLVEAGRKKAADWTPGKTAADLILKLNLVV